MVRNAKFTGTAAPMALGITLGVGIAFAILGVSAAVIAWLVLGEKMDISAVGYAVMVCHLLSVGVGGIAASGMIKHRKLAVCLSVGGVYYLSLIGCTAAFFGGQYQGMGVTAILVAAASGLAGWLTTRGKNNGTKRYKKYRNR